LSLASPFSVYTCMRQYYVLNSSAHLKSVFEFIHNRGLSHEVHLNRTRFWIDPNSIEFSEFALQWADHCDPVESPQGWT
jgi:hypothetical protein